MIEQAILIGVAAWRVAALLSYEGGPFDIFKRFREMLGFTHYDNGKPANWPDNPLTSLVACVWCLSIWAALGMYGLWELEPIVVIVIAASSIVVVVEKWNNG